MLSLAPLSGVKPEQQSAIPISDVDTARSTMTEPCRTLVAIPVARASQVGQTGTSHWSVTDRRGLQKQDRRPAPASFWLGTRALLSSTIIRPRRLEQTNTHHKDCPPQARTLTTNETSPCREDLETRRLRRCRVSLREQQAIVSVGAYGLTCSRRRRQEEAGGADGRRRPLFDDPVRTVMAMANRGGLLRLFFEFADDNPAR